MSSYVAVADGNWGTAATWNTVTNTPTIHASTNITVATTNLFTATFTAPNTTNKCTGVLLFITSIGSVANNFTATLQESTVDTTATGSFTGAAITATTGWVNGAEGTFIYIPFAIPYQFTTTAAGAYRFRLVSGASLNAIFAADSGGLNVAFLATDDRTTAPASSDQVYIAGTGAASRTVTATGTSNVCGGGTDITSATIVRSLGFGMQIGLAGTVAFDTSASATITCGGTVGLGQGSVLKAGTSGTPYPAGFTATLAFAQTGSLGFGVVNMRGGQLSLYGNPLTFRKTQYSSGSGTTGSPLVVADTTGWSVNDELYIAPSSNNAGNRTEGERKYVKTISGTSITLSATAGGAESGLINTHTSADIFNLTRNVIITTTNTSFSNFVFVHAFTNAGLPVANVTNTRIEYCGGTATNKEGVRTGLGVWDGSVAYNSTRTGFMITNPLLASVSTYNNLVSYGATSFTGFYLNSGSGSTTFNNCYALAATAVNGWLVNNNVQTYNNCKAIACLTGFTLQSVSNQILNGCEVQCCGTGIAYNGVSASIISCLVGTRGYNQTADQAVTSNTYNTATATFSTFSSPTFLSNYLNSLSGSLLAYHALGNVDNTHKWYTAYGSAQATGAALADTTVRTTSSLGVRLSPENSTTGFSWVFYIPAKKNTIVGFTGYLQRSSAFSSGNATVSMYLPGNDYTISTNVADASYTLPTTTGSWLPVNISANYGGTVDGLATIVINAQSATASAYLYADDFYNAGDGTTTFDKVTGLDVWDKGLPISIIAPQTPSSADIASNVTTDIKKLGVLTSQGYAPIV